MLAIASLFEETQILGRPIDDTSSGTGDVAISRPNAVATGHYTKALRGIQMQLGSGRSDPVTILTACMVFTCMEALRGNTEAALSHIKNGSKILEDASNAEGSKIPHMEQDISDSLVFSFKRLRILSSSIQEMKQSSPPSQQSMPGNPMNVPSDIRFRSLEEARYVQGMVMTNAAIVVYGATQAVQKKAQGGPDSALADRIRVDAQLRQWTHAFDNFLKDNQHDVESNHTKSGLVLLRFFSKLCSIRLWVSFLPPGPALNSLTTDFNELLNLAEDCTTLQSQEMDPVSGKTGKPPLFVMDMGIVPGVFFAACKCPDVGLRLRAINMLERTPRREALWDSVTAARMARSALNAGRTWPNASQGDG